MSTTTYTCGSWYVLCVFYAGSDSTRSTFPSPDIFRLHDRDIFVCRRVSRDWRLRSETDPNIGNKYKTAIKLQTHFGSWKPAPKMGLEFPRVTKGCYPWRLVVPRTSTDWMGTKHHPFVTPENSRPMLGAGFINDTGYHGQSSPCAWGHSR